MANLGMRGLLSSSFHAFLIDSFAENPAEVRQGRIRDDGVHPEIRIGVERLLLPLDDELVFHEPLDHAVAERCGDGGVVEVVVVQVIPEEMRRARRFGREELAIAILLGAFQVRSEERRVGKECRYRWSRYY